MIVYLNEGPLYVAMSSYKVYTIDTAHLGSSVVKTTWYGPDWLV